MCLGACLPGWLAGMSCTREITLPYRCMLTPHAVGSFFIRAERNILLHNLPILRNGDHMHAAAALNSMFFVLATVTSLVLAAAAVFFVHKLKLKWDGEATKLWNRIWAANIASNGPKPIWPWLLFDCLFCAPSYIHAG
jgi:hypothetical protein